MRALFVVLRDPSESTDDNTEESSPSVRPASVQAGRLTQAYYITVDLPVASSTRFRDQLETHLVREMPTCRLVKNMILVTGRDVSWDQVLPLKNWIKRWVDGPVDVATG
jgi:hypothetical protein